MKHIKYFNTICLLFLFLQTGLQVKTVLAEEESMLQFASDQQVEGAIANWFQKSDRFGRMLASQQAKIFAELPPEYLSDASKFNAALNDTNDPQYRKVNDLLGSAYYDRLLAFERLGSETGDSSWYEHSTAHLPVWLAYIKNSGAKIPGRWYFTGGMEAYYLRTKDARIIPALRELSLNVEYTRVDWPDETGWAITKSPVRSREVAYALRGMLTYERLKYGKQATPKSPRINALVDFALGHIDQWFNESAKWAVPNEDGSNLGSPVRYVRPFMVALTVEALLDYYDTYKDSSTEAKRCKEIRAASRLALSQIWTSSWNWNKRAFSYTDRDLSKDNPDYDELGKDPQPDLNLLIAPVYQRLYDLGEVSVQAGLNNQQRADLILVGGMQGTSDWSWQQNKQYNQQHYHEVARYLKKRRANLHP